MVTGATTTNGITNTGNIGTTTLTTTGNATVGGALAVTGATTTNGITNTGNITNSGVLTTGSLSVTGNSSLGGALAVTGNYTTTNGNITTTNGTISGAALVSTGATSVGTNLTVGGNATVTGNYSTTLGNITTTSGRIQAGTVTVNAGGSNRVSGLANAILSTTSTDAVTGQQLHATNLALTALDVREAAHFNLLSARADKADQGIAMAFASNAAPLNLSNGEGGVSGGVGVYQGEWAGAIRAQYVMESGVGVGINVGFSENAVGGGAGVSVKF